MPEALLQVTDLNYVYADGTKALRGVHLNIARSEKVGLIGPNGSGKSTLLMCLGGLFAGHGMVRLNGAKMNPARIPEQRGSVGLVFQSPDDQLFMPTLADDLAFGPINLGLTDEQVRDRVVLVAEQMGLTSLLDRPPHHLSLGQQRSAAIAAVLAMHPALLLLDEPSSNLDPRARRQLIGVLEPMATAMLIAAHDLALIGRLCGRVLLIDEGRIVADGPTAEIMGDKDLMEQHGLEPWREQE